MTRPHDGEEAWDWLSLYRRARAIGVSPDAFWRMTPRELAVEFEAGEERAEREFEAIVVSAWYHEYIHLRAMQKKKLEPVSAYLNKAAQAQTPAEQLAAMRQVSEMFGIPLTTTNQEAHGQQATG